MGRAYYHESFPEAILYLGNPFEMCLHLPQYSYYTLYFSLGTILYYCPRCTHSLCATQTSFVPRSLTGPSWFIFIGWGEEKMGLQGNDLRNVRQRMNRKSIVKANKSQNLNILQDTMSIILEWPKNTVISWWTDKRWSSKAPPTLQLCGVVTWSLQYTINNYYVVFRGMNNVFTGI